jgi:hypothetical protein
MRCFAALVAAALALAAPTSAIAKSGYVRLPEPKVVRVGVPIPDLQCRRAKSWAAAAPNAIAIP